MYSKGDRAERYLVQCTELRTDQNVRKAAVSKLDSRRLVIVSRDLVGAEGQLPSVYNGFKQYRTGQWGRYQYCYN